MFNLRDPFVSMLVHAFIGAFVGAVGGLIMLYFIIFVSWLISPGTQVLIGQVGEIVFPAMGMGSVVGTILGGIAGLRKTR